MIRSPLVTDDHTRPACPGMCFYCRIAVGAAHLPDCVAFRRTVVVDVTIRIVREVPAHWTPHDVEFSLNDSSSCLDNILSDLSKHACLCSRSVGRFVREADEEEDRTRYAGAPETDG